MNVEFYITAWDDVTAPFFEALVAAAERGVTVRLLFDHLGSKRHPRPSRSSARLDATDIEWHRCCPSDLLQGKFRRPDLRNHRKILVVDGRVGFTGSQNLDRARLQQAQEPRSAGGSGSSWWPGSTGRGHALRAVFAKDWYTETEERMGEESAPAPAEPRHARRRRRARWCRAAGLRRREQPAPVHRADLLAPAPDLADQPLLRARRAPAVRRHDRRPARASTSSCSSARRATSSWSATPSARTTRRCSRRGSGSISTPRRPSCTPSTSTIDDDVAVIGSSNMDMRSFALNYEISLMLTGGDMVGRFREVEDTYRAAVARAHPRGVGQRPGRLRYVDNAMRLTAALQ